MTTPSGRSNKIVQPPSKTAICHVDYPLGDEARLSVFPITLIRRNNTSKVENPIISQKLRRNAILEFLTQYSLQDRVAVQFWAKKNAVDEKVEPIDEIIVLASDSEATNMIRNSQKKDFDLKETVATIKADDGTTVQETIHCDLRSHEERQLTAQDPDCSEYWKKIELLVRKFVLAMSTEDGNTSAVAVCKTGALLQEAVKRANKNEATYNRFPNFQTTINGAALLKILFRTTLKLDPHNRKLRVEIDLVPGIKGGMDLSDLITGTFASDLLDVSNDQLVRNTKRMLVGLAVVRKYQPIPKPVSASSNRTTGMSHSYGGLPNSPKSNRPALASMTNSEQNARADQPSVGSNSSTGNSLSSFPESIIVDVKSAAQVPDFWKDGVRYTATQYLLKTYPELKSTKLLGLPLANIGKNTWVPFEFLRTAGDARTLQQISYTGFMTASLQERRADYDLNAENRTRLLDFVNGQMKNIRGRLMGMDLVISKGNGELSAVDFSSNETKRPTRAPIEATNTSAAIKCGIIYVQPNGIRSRNFESFARSIRKLLNDYATQNQEGQIVKMDTSHTIPIATIPGIKPLLLESGDTIEEIKPFYDTKVDTIVAVVDERGRSKQEIRFIRAELQKFGNKKLGAIVVCVGKKDLELRTDKTTGLPTHLRLGMLQQLNAMHGNPNFEIQNLPSLDLAGKKLMIVGAHISHAGPGAAASCPSVAALVGSIDEALVHYTGSARLQPTNKTTPWRSDREPTSLMYKVESQIIDLESMMLERIEAWAAKQGRTNAPHIVFYRHSNRSGNGDVVAEEKAAIQRACDQSTWICGTTTFDYVLVNKNAHVFSPYRNALSEDFTAHAKSEFNIAESTKQVGYKYQYYIQDTTHNVLTAEQCKTLTCHLNSNFQQKNANLAIVLPVHYAQKLAKRMYDYFRFAITNRYDELSAIQREVGFSNEETVKNDRRMAAMMTEYLLNYGVLAPREGPEPEWKNPWMPQLDQKMFYL